MINKLWMWLRVGSEDTDEWFVWEKSEDWFDIRGLLIKIYCTFKSTYVDLLSKTIALVQRIKMVEYSSS